MVEFFWLIGVLLFLTGMALGVVLGLQSQSKRRVDGDVIESVLSEKKKFRRRV
ncbi:MAG: hypothetical protein GXO16_05805 [Epsilonproteobacteria bacterium]|nr:hypothetical protein [Campylobacterota bacterium]